MKHRILHTVTDVLIVAMVLYAWLSMFAGADRGNLLSSAGIAAMKYFTVDSNLLLMISCVACLVNGRKGKPGRFPRFLKYSGTVAVSLTFLTVFLIFVPAFGVMSMIQGANLFFHLIVPVLAVIVFVAGKGAEGMPFSVTLPAVVPTLLYAIAYAANILVNGSSYETDWYGFARWGPKLYLPAILLACAVTWGIAAVLWLVGGGAKNMRRQAFPQRHKTESGNDKSDNNYRY